MTPPPDHGPEPAVAVTFVGSHAELGGSERYLELLLEALGADWVDRVVTLADGPAAARLRDRGVAVEILPTGRRAGLITGAWRLRRTLTARGRRPAVVHANGVKAALVCALGLVGSGVPVVWVKHDFSWDGPLGRTIAAGCAEVVGVSAAVLAHLRRGRPRSVRRPVLTVVPNGIPVPVALPDGAEAAVRAELGVAADAALVTLVGRLHPAKGQLELLAVAPAVLKEAPALHLLLVGPEDPFQAAYATKVRETVAGLGLEGRVTLTGQREDVGAIMAESQAIVIPSVPDERGMGREGFGLAGIEALAAGTPVVGYADGALPEVLGDAALLVAPGDRTALAGALVSVLADPGLGQELAARGRARFASRYTIIATAQAMQARYLALAQVRGRMGR